MLSKQDHEISVIFEQGFQVRQTRSYILYINMDLTNHRYLNKSTIICVFCFFCTIIVAIAHLQGFPNAP